jgi:RecB family endonuclease NucS
LEGARRIDLLGIDKQANMVVIELIRDDAGSHMELQALRHLSKPYPSQSPCPYLGRVFSAKIGEHS